MTVVKAGPCRVAYTRTKEKDGYQAVCLGFGILALSQVPANARLGGLLVLSLVNCFVATMLILPAILSVRSRRSQATRIVPMGG